MKLIRPLPCQWVLIFVTLTMGIASYGQNYLARHISLDPIQKTSIGNILERLQEGQDFYFSFNSDLIPEDSIISVDGFRGTLRNYLQTIFDQDYELKTTPGYIIIRFAPRSMELNVNIEQTDQALVISGKILDEISQTPINNVSIYERNVPASTLSDKNGLFSLSLKRPGSSNWITISRENYKDTTLLIFSPVQIQSSTNARKYVYFPEQNNNGSKLFESFFGRLFISSRQRIQQMNIGGFFAFSPYQISLAPGFSTQGLFTSQIVNQVSINLTGGYTAGVNGVEVAGGFNINHKDARYAQVAGLFNLVGGQAKGVQLAGGANIIMEKVKGVQVSGILNSTAASNGLQIAGAINRTREANGIQIAGISNTASLQMEGVQLTGLYNRASSINGLQFSGLTNHAKKISGAQIAGCMNIAKKVQGIQIAPLINIADSSDYPIAFLNFIKNGQKSISLAINESGIPGAAFRSGGKVLYGFIGVSYHSSPQNNPLYSPEGGIGARLYRSLIFNLDVEITNRTNTDFKSQSYSQVSFRILPGINIGNHLRFTIGPSVNFTYGNQITTDLVKIPGWILHKRIGEENVRALHAGIRVELQYFW
ncbi:carboxypeptidase-like regulatory domain-containing protein [Membranihabitans maritimus]|uniref:carboxypeptidase-like regulatory domain-containing protein n=1 Tax=Membranihabitans maritimus TaxID=2904244 RepID=UPI001F227FB2|nr:carboxypeptidase-like regulatory domain-containing protein [Membranihabitans maritimus]